MVVAIKHLIHYSSPSHACRHPGKVLCLLWLGSSVGNLDPAEASAFFKDVLRIGGASTQVCYLMHIMTMDQDACVECSCGSHSQQCFDLLYRMDMKPSCCARS